MKIKLIKSRSFVRIRVLFLIMKAFIFLLCTTVFGFTTEKSFSQVKISIDVDKVVSVDEVFEIIQDQTKYRFLYPADLFANAPKVQLKKGEIGVDELLKQSLSHSEVEFELSQKNRIVIHERNASGQPSKVFLQQQFEISGMVLDEVGVPLPGASIIEKGTTNGTQSDFDGSFSLSVTDEKATIQISYIGFETKEISVNGQKNITVTLAIDAAGLEEVVVVGYGTQKRRDLTGAVSSISTQDIVRSNPVQAAAALQGQVTGININKVKGRPGDGFTIDIRGLSSFGDSESSAPLVVIDGVVGGDINVINPNDIAAMDVLKDASSTAIYGSRGANGVIIITTKKGVSGKPKVTYKNYTGIKVPTHLPNMMNAQQFYNKNYVLRPQETGKQPRNITDSELANVQNGRTVDWLDLVTGAALQSTHDISLSGGSDKTTYDFSAGYLNEEGNTLETGFKRYTVKGGIQSILNDKLKVGMSTYYTYSKQNLAGTEALRSAYRARPTGTNFYDDLLPQDQAQDKDWNGYAVFMGINDNQVIHPLVEIDPENFVLETRRSSLLANAYVDFTPVKGLSFRSSLSTAVSNQREGDYRGTYTKSQKTTLLPKVNLQTTDISSYTLDNTITYNLNSGSHNLTITGLHSIFHERGQFSRIDVKDLPFRSLWYSLGDGEVTLNESSLTEKALISYMGRVNYSFKDKYLLTLTGRTDGASVLSEGNKWQFFPSVALAWQLGDEDFIKNANLFSDLKLRASYGEVGNATSINPYETQSTVSQTQYDFGGSPAYGFAINNLANKNLVWERSKEFNFGLNMGLFNNRISTAIEVYDRKTVDLILGDKIPNSTGFSDIVDNVGEIRNKGIEILLNTVNIYNEDFRWSTSINFTKNENEVTKLAGGISRDIGNNRFVGESVQPLYYYEVAGIWQTSEADEAATFGYKPGNVKFIDQNGDGKITEDDDRVIVGSETPDYIMGIRNQFNYKDFDFSFFIYTRQGVKWKSSYLTGTFGEVDGDRYNVDATLDFWTSTNPTNNYFGLEGAGGSGKAPKDSFSIVDANFVRISDITLGYTLPHDLINRLNIGHLRIYAQATNPFLFTNTKGFSPEYNSGINSDDVPFAMYALGLNITF
ncbi:TonB-dependent receptor P3 [Arenibacter antarcticus]|uniref:SusC/RagA family TonB-linked outer membrane protein n=2 Tax=Arenibacter antarcticus TaxID=2040469 RepID=A0ABW5VGF8_9FLAO|nr:TonB-dependent receptor [Arenibacter sp. H213]MCM4167118.1 SusC/RagA family TonB-linked outer membrane protein [Arenibacter sp. H213]